MPDIGAITDAMADKIICGLFFFSIWFAYLLFALFGLSFIVLIIVGIRELIEDLFPKCRSRSDECEDGIPENSDTGVVEDNEQHNIEKARDSFDEDDEKTLDGEDDMSSIDLHEKCFGEGNDKSFVDLNGKGCLEER